MAYRRVFFSFIRIVVLVLLSAGYVLSTNETLIGVKCFNFREKINIRETEVKFASIAQYNGNEMGMFVVGANKCKFIKRRARKKRRLILKFIYIVIYRHTPSKQRKIPYCTEIKIKPEHTQYFKHERPCVQSHFQNRDESKFNIFFST